MRALRCIVLCAVFVTGCDVSLPYGTFRCADDSGCPEGWACRGGYCYPGMAEHPSTNPKDAGADGGGEPDTGTTDTDSGLRDAGPTGGPREEDASTPAVDVEDAAVDGGEPPNEGTPEVDGPCDDSGAKACRGHASFDKLVCQGGRWMIIGVCDGSTRCNTKPGPSQGSCQPIATLCLDKNPGDAICDGTTRKRCDADLLGYEAFDCPAAAHCTSDETAAVSCACDSGYTDDGAGGCVNVDDCGGANPCDPGVCVDGLNAYGCECPTGYVSTGTTCANVDDCGAANPCDPGACVDGLNAFGCDCPSGYVSTGTTCANVNDCPSPDPCSPGACVDGVNAFSCSCPTGYDAVGGDCVCPSGFTDTGTMCANIDDCVNHQCWPGSCQDAVNGYWCECPECYTPGDGVCIDLGCGGGGEFPVPR